VVSEHGHGCQHAAFHHVRSINIASRNGHITHGACVWNFHSHIKICHTMLSSRFANHHMVSKMLPLTSKATWQASSTTHFQRQHVVFWQISRSTDTPPHICVVQQTHRHCHAACVWCVLYCKNMCVFRGRPNRHMDGPPTYMLLPKLGVSRAVEQNGEWLISVPRYTCLCEETYC